MSRAAKVEGKKKGKIDAVFAVELAKLRTGPFFFDQEIPREWLVDELSYCEYKVVLDSASLAIELKMSGEGVLVKGEVHVKVKTECSTCLGEVLLDLNPAIHAYMVKEDLEEELRSSVDLTPEDLEREFFSGEVVVLDSLLRDTIMLELPINPKCGDSCPGIPLPASGGNKQAIDQRLALLAGIKLEREK